MSLKTEPNLPRRALATLIDYGFFIACNELFVSLYGSPNTEGEKTLDNDPLALVPIVIWVIWFPLAESTKGQTLGKMITGLRVVTMAGNTISFVQAMKRRILDFLDFLVSFGLVAIVAVKNTPNHQRLGDLWAKTIVIRINAASCSFCGASLILSNEEAINKEFTCPACGKTNIIANDRRQEPST